jgi:hypothetical protein
LNFVIGADGKSSRLDAELNDRVFLGLFGMVRQCRCNSETAQCKATSYRFSTGGMQEV